jgi:Protein of unknown function (DUF2752)
MRQMGAKTIEFSDVRGPSLRAAGVALLGAAAVWNVLPVHPPLACPLRTATGLPCPFCGMTRAVVAAVHGDIATSLTFNPAGVLVVALAVYVVVAARLPRTRAPASLVIGFFAALWAWNLFGNSTFN